MSARLTQIASTLTPDTRRELLHAVTDLYLTDDERSEEAAESYSDIATRTLDGMCAGDRAVYAFRVAREPRLPRRVAQVLASDQDPSVASSVLKHSSVLQEEDVTSVALTASQDHLKAIAARPRVSETVAEVLVTRGDRAVVQAVVEDQGALLSDEALARLATRTELHLDIVSILVRRFGVERVQRLIKRERIELGAVIAEVRSKHRSIGSGVQQLADEGRALDIAEMLSMFEGSPTAEILRSLLAEDGDEIMTFCRTVGVREDEFASVAKLRAIRRRLPPSAAAREIALYASKLETKVA
jgi:hypothetical protein